ncbi:MAG: hypothetical protein PHO86_03040 [Bacilli bacterium]|nr:hypothetical protein [Bacilli bacterium]
MSFMKSNAKRLFLVLVAFALCFGLIGCKEVSDEPTLQETLESAVGSIVMDKSIGTLSSNLVLPEKAAGEYEITWTIAENAYASIAENRDGVPMIKISRPEASVGYQKFVIVATITKDDASATREWEGYVKPLAEGIEILDAAGVKAAELNTSLLIQGTVMIVCKSAGFWVADETGAVYVYGATGDVQPGDVVSVTGSKTLYYSLVEIENPGITIDEEGTGTYPYAEKATAGTADTIIGLDSTVQANYGTLYTIEGTVISDVNSGGSYTYGIKDFKTGNSVTVYDSCTNADALETLGTKLGQYIKLTVVVYDLHSNGYWRVLAINSTIEDATIPTISDNEKVSTTKTQLINDLEGKILYADVNLPTTNDFEGLTISWASDKPEVLSAEGVKGTSTEIENAVKLTATITAGAVTEVVEINVNVFMLAKTTVTNALYTCDNGGDTVWLEGKIIALDVDGYFYLADETGVIYVRTKLTDVALGDSVKVIGKTTYYDGKGKQWTRQMTATSITKLETEVTPIAAVPATIADFPAIENEGGVLTAAGLAAVKAHSAYGRIIEITGYVQTRGSQGDIYLCETAEETSAGVCYYYKSINQTEIKALVGKLVKFTCAVYDGAGAAGWRLGSCLSYEEVTTPIVNEPTAGAVTVAAVIAAEKDAAVTVDAVVKYIYSGNGIVIEDATGSIYVYGKTISGVKVGDKVSVTGTKGEYKEAPQIANPTVTVKATGTYTYTYEVTTLAELNAMSYEDKTIFGKVFKIVGTPVASGNFINIKSGEVTLNLFNDTFNKSVLADYVDVEIEMLVVVYQFSNGTYNLFPIVSTIVSTTPAA